MYKGPYIKIVDDKKPGRGIGGHTPHRYKALREGETRGTWISLSTSVYGIVAEYMAATGKPVNCVPDLV